VGVLAAKLAADLAARIALNLSDDPLAPPITMHGGTGWDVNNRLMTAQGGGYRGNVAGFTAACVFRINTQVTSAYLVDYLDSSGKGYGLFQDTATTLTWRSAKAAGNDWWVSAKYSPAPDLGKVQLSVMTYSGAGGWLTHWCSNEKVGADVATDGYVLPQTTIRQSIGVRGIGANAHTGADIFCWGAWGRVLTDAEIHGLYATVASTGKLPLGISGQAQICNVTDNVTTAAFPSTIVDQVGGSNFTFVTGVASGVDLVTLTGPVIA
jgi:hypothetical protein